jgi:hypothetical protein
MLKKRIHNMFRIATLETNEAIFSQFASEYVADANLYHIFQARQGLSNLAPGEKGCDAQAAKSDEYASRRVAVILSDYSVLRDFR